jgi:hypothetical protein
MADTSVQKVREDELKITRSSKTHSMQIQWMQIALKSLHKPEEKLGKDVLKFCARVVAGVRKT